MYSVRRTSFAFPFHVIPIRGHMFTPKKMWIEYTTFKSHVIPQMDFEQARFTPEEFDQLVRSCVDRPS
ncbi:hypothetical protein JTE90_007154 [Oedothorax gibbosus]|uniref:Uncharacterized protein n=1 Tax=Oedothorax gibbosus TaxID=931172 RepID=A0AAV6UVQ6_9ARAC|nr:hypothetical protein JTE90_007154 [Oedothorax gibbosus]